MNNTLQMYDAQASSIKVEDIAAYEPNRLMLSRIKRNSEEDKYNQDLWIQNHYDDEGEGCVDYVPEGVYDMGWLGYFVGKSNQLNELYFRDFDNMSIDVIKSFIMGVNRNRSITSLDFRMDLLDGKIFTIMAPFFENNSNLAHITIQECQLGDGGWRLLALAIGSSKHKSLKTVVLSENNISDEALVDMITALSMHPHIEEVYLSGNRLAANGCTTLATLLQNSCSTLRHLELDNNVINDEGIATLVPALNKCDHLRSLSLRNNSITSKGRQHLAIILEAPNSNLTSLSATGNNNVGNDDEVVTALANALVNNRTLKHLSMDISSTNVQQFIESAFSKLLCDTSSVNATFLSNHTLQSVGATMAVKQLLKLNKRKNKEEVAMIKILQNHNEINMMPFFEWEFKVLPLMIKWLEKASSITLPDNYEPNIEPRKLSSIYQFIRGMPLLYVEARLKKELEDIKEELPHNLISVSYC